MDAQAAARVGKLDEVLRKLPREYKNQQRLRNDVASLLRDYATLQPSLSSFTGGGRTVTLFYLTGVLPIAFRGSNYNIPVTVYFDPPYPQSAPRCFVTPTKDMAIKPDHANVDKGGLIHAPFLSNWNQASSTLPEIVASLVSIFSMSPPVHSTAGAAARQQTSGYASASVVTASSSPGFTQEAEGGIGSVISGLFGGRQQQPQPQPKPQVPVVQAQLVSAHPQPVVAQVVPQGRAVSSKDAAVKAVSDIARARWPVVVRPMVDEVNKQLQNQAELEVHSKKVEDELSQLKAATERNDGHEAELRELEGKLRQSLEVTRGELPDTETLLGEMQPESQQVLECLSEEMALEEFLVALDDLLAGGQLNIDDFMREVRDVGRKQFMVRLERLKAAAAATGVAPAAAAAATVAPAAATAPRAAPAGRVAVPA